MPTNISLKRYNVDYNQVLERKPFLWSQDVAERSTGNVLYIEENAPYALSIDLADDDRLYLDGIEMLPDGNEDAIATDDKGESYVGHSTQFALYNHDDTNKYLPGIYRLCLVHSGTPYYAYLQVQSKYLSDEEYQRLVQDIERTSAGLTKSFQRGHHGSTDFQHAPEDDLRRLAFLEKDYAKFLTTMFQLQRHLRSEIAATHRWGYNINSSLDHRSINKMTSNPQQNKIYSKHHTIDYNIPDNIGLKSDLLRIKGLVRPLFRKYQDDSPCLQGYLSDLDYLLTHSELRSVDTKYVYHAALSSRMMNPNYAFVHRFVQKLQNATVPQNAPQREYSFDLKSTEHLYEIWGYLKVLSSLQTLGFRATSGWLVDDPDDVRKNVTQGLAPNTNVQMTMDGTNERFHLGMKVNVIYDAPMSRSEDDANPVWSTSRHNRPDVRLDFMDDDDTYVGSIVMDTKYRKVYNFMQDTQNGSLRQLSDYKQYVLSPHIFASARYNSAISTIYQMNKFPVVTRVGAMFPGIVNHEEDDSSHEYGTDKEKLHLKDQVGVYPILAYPGKSEQRITEFLEDSIRVVLKNVQANLA